MTEYEGIDASETKDESFLPVKASDGVKKVKLMDKNQCHVADKKAVSNRGLAMVLTNDANKAGVYKI